MSTRPAFYHPYPSPAGIRIADYVRPRRCFNLFQGPDFTNTRSPAPSPLSSPIRGPRHPEDVATPNIHLADLFGTPQRPSTPTPDHHRNAIPNVKETNVPAQDPLRDLPRRKDKGKGKHGPKHLTFNNAALRSGIFPHHRRAQQQKEKRDTVRRRIFDHHERHAAWARKGISTLRREAEALMTPEHMDDQDKIFLKQLRNLELDHDLEQCRQQMSCAAAESTKRTREHEERDEAAAKMWGESQDAEALEDQKRKVAEFVRGKEERRQARRQRMEEAGLRADEERRRAHEAVERKIREEQEVLFRQEQARKAKEEEERRRREEQERKLREEQERQLREERERQLREEQERKFRETLERLRREAHERFLREERERRAREERERQARFVAEQARRAALDDQVGQHFVVYEGKWNELRSTTGSNSIPPIDVREMPWPVFGVISSADQITYQDVRTFLFHPQRPGVEGKTARDKVKSEVLRFHPDKFNTRIVPKVQPSQKAVAQEIAGAVARILTRIMTEEVEQQK